MSSVPGSCQTVCVMRSGPGLYALPAHSICEVLDWQVPSRVPLAPRDVAGAIVYQGEVLTVICLRSLLDQSPSCRGDALVVLEDPHTLERFALAVDTVEEVVSIAESGIEPNPQTLSPKFQAMFAGISRCSTELLVLLNLSSLTPDTLFEKLGPPEKVQCKGRTPVFC